MIDTKCVTLRRTNFELIHPDMRSIRAVTNQYGIWLTQSGHFGPVMICCIVSVKKRSASALNQEGHWIRNSMKTVTCKLWRPLVGDASINDRSVCSTFRHGLFGEDGTSVVLDALLAAFRCCFSSLRWARRNFAFSFKGFVGSAPTILDVSVFVDSSTTFALLIGVASALLDPANGESMPIFSKISPTSNPTWGWYWLLSLSSSLLTAAQSSVFAAAPLSQSSSLPTEGVRIPFSKNAFIFLSTFLCDFDGWNARASHLPIEPKKTQNVRSVELSTEFAMNWIYNK